MAALLGGLDGFLNQPRSSSKAVGTLGLDMWVFLSFWVLVAEHFCHAPFHGENAVGMGGPPTDPAFLVDCLKQARCQRSTRPA